MIAKALNNDQRFPHLCPGRKVCSICWWLETKAWLEEKALTEQIRRATKVRRGVG